MLCSWYAFILRYDPAALNGVPIDEIYAALQAEGCIELDRPGSTQPLNELALFAGPRRCSRRMAGGSATVRDSSRTRKCSIHRF